MTGSDATHVLAYARLRNQKAAIVIALRHFAGPTGRRWPKFDAIDAQVRLGDSQLRLEGSSGDLLEVRAVLNRVAAVVLLGDVAPSPMRVASEKRHPEPARPV